MTSILNHQGRLKHWSMLAEALYMSLQECITNTEINQIHQKLTTFVSEAEDLYSLTAMTYNTYQLLHISESIRDWGPLWAQSAFCFETANHKLLCSINSAKGVIQQILRHLNLHRTVERLQQIVYPNCSETVVQFCEDIANIQTKKIFKLSDITYFGRGKIIDQFTLEKFSCSRYTKVFSKIVMRGTLYTSSEKVNTRSCNYFIKFVDKRFVKIVKFLVDTENKKELTISQVIKVRPSQYANYINEVVEITDELIAVETSQIAKVCTFIETPSKNYIIPVANSLFY